MTKWVIGVDEAGRGPLAGPVAVGAVLVSADFDWDLIPGVTDSKKLSEKRREDIFKLTKELSRDGLLSYRVSMVSAHVIDRIGITKAVRLGVARGIRGLEPDPKVTFVKLDGLLKAPEEFLMQETIPKGDLKEKEIGLASIMAKVTRDRYMIKKGSDFPLYGFEIHKGYGTKAHREALKKHGLCPLHRVCFTHLD